uniref:Uncharacterized protein n=1 Tax=Rhizophora mucronata TaxID=61149 RepID=A0A2P2M6D9_RHIMU
MHLDSPTAHNIQKEQKKKNYPGSLKKFTGDAISSPAFSPSTIPD